MAAKVRTTSAIDNAAKKGKQVDRTKVTLIATDDRLVKFSDPLSNHAKLDQIFSPKGAKLVSLVEDSALGDYREAGRLADARLGLIQWPLDLVCLGMGDDGHTASIFPGPDLDAAVAGPRERRAVGVRPDPLPEAAPVDRVTLTAAAFSSARTLMVVIRGQEKRDVLEKALEQGPLSSYPIGRVLADVDAAVDVFWSPD